MQFIEYSQNRFLFSLRFLIFRHLTYSPLSITADVKFNKNFAKVNYFK